MDFGQEPEHEETVAKAIEGDAVLKSACAAACANN